MPPVCQVSFCLLDARSVCDVKQDGKATVICDHIDDNNLDILSAGRICYQLLLVQRAHGTSCGVAVNGSHSTLLIVVYRSPPNIKSCYTASEFLVEFAHLMDIMAMDRSNVLIVGDFIFHMDDETNNETGRFIDLLKAGDRTQHIEGPTHVAGHTIGLLITRSSDAFLDNIRIDIPHMPDHSAILCTLRLAKPPNIQVTTTSRSNKHVSTAAICEDIRSLLLSKHLPDNMIYAVDMYNETIGPVIYKHEPLTRHTVTVRPHTQWYNDSVRSQKCVRCQLERRWRTTGLECDRLAYCLQRQLVTLPIHRAKLEYHSSLIAVASGDQKQLFKIVAKFPYTNNDTPLPPCDSFNTLKGHVSDVVSEKSLENPVQAYSQC